MPKCVTCNGAGVVDYLFEGKPLGWKCPACEGTGNAQDVTVPRGYDCCDPTSPSHDPVVVRLEAEVERLNTAWKAIDRANESLREQLGTLRGLLREADQIMTEMPYYNGSTASWQVKAQAALEGKP